MEPIKLDPETRKRRIPDGQETTVHDAHPPRRLRAPGAPPERPWLVPAVAVAVVAVVMSCMAIVYRMGVSRGSKDAALNAGPSAAPTRVLLLDPVCKKAVDPNNAPAVLDFGGKSIYFDSLDCLNAFRADPVKYGAGRIRVHISPQTEREPLSDASPGPAASTDAAATVPDAAPTPDADMAPGGPPEPPGTDSSLDSAPKDAPKDDGPLNQAPEPAPDQGPQPQPKSVNDAPPVTESYPSQPPTDLPAKAPKVPEMGEKGRPPAKAAPKKQTTELPKAAPPADNADPNGFSLPPELKEGPPPRKGGGKKTAPASGGAPSVDEGAPGR